MDEYYKVDEVTISVQYYQDKWEQQQELVDELLVLPDGFGLRFQFPDGEEYVVGVKLPALVELYATIYTGESGYVGVGHGYLKIEHQSGDVNLDLSRRVGIHDEREETIELSGPTVMGPRETILESLQKPIQEVLTKLSEYEVDREELRYTYLVDSDGEPYDSALWNHLID